MPAEQTSLTHPPAPARRLTTVGAITTIHAPCKINLGLRIFPPRPDGFHNLESWMAPIALHDTLTIDPAPASPNQLCQLRITGRSAGIPTDLQKNLVGRAALALAKHANIQPTGTITLHKVVPHGGGLGGGSSDAAHALIALNHAWKLHLPRETLLTLAATLGSDVPLFIDAVPALCTGRGEMMTPLFPKFAPAVVLIIPPQGLGTGPVYKMFDQMLDEEINAATPQSLTIATPQSRTVSVRNRPPIDWHRLSQLPPRDLNNALTNDLEPAAFALAPWLANLRTRTQQIAHQKIHMTGSGSTLFTLCDSLPIAESLATTLNTHLKTDATCLPTFIL